MVVVVVSFNQCQSSGDRAMQLTVAVIIYHNQLPLQPTSSRDKKIVRRSYSQTTRGISNTYYKKVAVIHITHKKCQRNIDRN